MPTQIVVSIAPKSQEDFDQLYAEARPLADLVEIRLDNGFWPECSFDGEPVLLTGGDIARRAGLLPMMLDIPYPTDPEVIARLKKKYPKIKLLGSVHDYTGLEDPIELIQKLDQMDVDCIKVAKFCGTSVQALELVSILRSPPAKKPLTLVPMGEKASFGRIVAACMGSQLTFTCLEGRPTAIGQLHPAEMRERYRVKTSTDLYALIGSPVCHSPSHITHNKVFEKLGKPAVYVKIDIPAEEFEPALALMQKCRFTGLSVTMPLKERFGEYPVNTLSTECSNTDCSNTDGKAVVDLLAEHLEIERSTILVLGAGGTGHAIVKELRSKGAKVIIANRTASRAQILARKYGATTCGLHQVEDIIQNVDGIVQATSQDRLYVKNVLPRHIVLDVILSPETEFLKNCREAGATTISGFRMWARQASYQFQTWIGADPFHVEELLHESL